MGGQIAGLRRRRERVRCSPGRPPECSRGDTPNLLAAPSITRRRRGSGPDATHGRAGPRGGGSRLASRGLRRVVNVVAVSMARIVVLLATVATCVALSLTGEDRQARSGDLDRGPAAPASPGGPTRTSAVSGRVSVVGSVGNDGGGGGGESVNATVALERRLEMSTEFFLVPAAATTRPPPGRHVLVVKTAPPPQPPSAERLAGVFRNEAWVIPLLALAGVTMALIACFEVFVLCKAWRTTPSRRHLFLGQMLLLGLFCCAGLAAVLAASPTRLTCAVARFGTGVAYAIVFAALLVKCVFLISLNGGVYLPAPYQGLLLLFAILIQVAVGVQWLLTSPPLVDEVPVAAEPPPSRRHSEEAAAVVLVPLCRTAYVDLLLSLTYVVFLVVFVTVLAVKSRGIRDNYRESTYIGLSVGCSIPTWLVWTTSGLLVGERHRDACVAFGLVVSSVAVFLIMFMPKGRQLAAMGKEGVYVEDREERFSSLSRAGSGYSPSFFHFKPIKYGLSHGGGAAGGGAPHKSHQHTVTTLGGGKPRFHYTY
ncbi:hypothetical protein NQ318_022661 [Aromia moschata]|uniref:G-protein coupled receptors family 3 profile domain-containing protein n=1 Tax=Aromia moschata TaxID=1265417 RepID=A0AAV8YN92_9CUCU|nr:hypothetical protein NQ318_022661 [Aromia moschata]